MVARRKRWLPRGRQGAPPSPGVQCEGSRMSWETGSPRIQELIDAGELGQVPPDLELAQRMLGDALRHLATAAIAQATGDLPGAYQLAYDGLRKSAASLLE